MKNRLILFGYRFAARVAQLVPRRALPSLEWLGGVVFFVVMRGRRSTVARHLRRIRPELAGRELARAVRSSFRSYAKYYAESFRLPALSLAEVRAGLTTEGYDYIVSSLEKGNGFVMAMPHLGGWEWAGRWAVGQGHHLAVVVEPLEPPELFEWFASLRRSFGMDVIALGPNAAAQVTNALKANAVLALLCDRDLHGNGVEVEFFGERTTMPAGPATLALRNGSALGAVAVFFDGQSNHHGVIRPIAVERSGSFREDVRRITQDIAHEFESLIRAAPEQWHLFQPNWPSDPGYRR